MLTVLLYFGEYQGRKGCVVECNYTVKAKPVPVVLDNE